jgi:hypothetical protein
LAERLAHQPHRSIDMAFEPKSVSKMRAILWPYNGVGLHARVRLQ